LDVHVANSIDVSLSHVDDSVKIGDGTDFMAVNADGSINAVVSAVDLDIRDLAFATDKVDVSGSSVDVTATNLDIRDLAFATDKVDVSGSSVDVNDAALANTAIMAGAETLATASTAQNAVASPLANRKYLMIYNKDNRKMYIGQSGVTEANGFPVSPGSTIELRAGASVDVEYVSPKLGHEIRHLELS